ncbi:MAG: T9SS type A sorting domain-containing protein [bacterium]|nr:T9SS type A sorting domain-containing protein [bacterium]
MKMRWILLVLVSFLINLLSTQSAGAQDSSHVSTLARWENSLLQDFTLNGNYAYLITDYYRLKIIDVSEQGYAREVGSYVSPNIIYGVDAYQNYVFLWEGAAGFQLLNVSDPAHPVLISTFTNMPNCYDVEMVGNYAYIAAQFGIYVLDLIDPLFPIVASAISATGAVNRIEYAHSALYVAPMNSNRISKVNLPTPINLQFDTTITFPRYLNNFIVRDSTIFVADYDGFWIYNVANFRNPTLLGVDSARNGYDFSVSGNYAYLRKNIPEISIVNIANPDSMYIAGSINFTSYPGSMTLSGARLGISSYPGLRFYSLTNPVQPRLVSFYSTGFAFQAVTLHDTLAYLLDDWFGTTIVDVSNPRQITPLGFIEAPLHGAATDIAIAGDLAYVAVGDSGLQVVSVANPVAPQLLTTFRTRSEATGITIDGMYGYVAVGDSGLQILNLYNPATPLPWGYCDTPGDAYRVVVRGNFAYVADGISGLRIINISNRLAPREVGFFNTTGIAYDVALAGNYAYVADGTGGLRVFDITNPVAPTAVGAFTDLYWIGGVALVREYAYLAAGDNGLSIVNISDPTDPHEIGYYASFNGVYDVDAVNATAYTAAGYEFGIYDCAGCVGVVNRANHETPYTYSLSQNYPNPFNATTTIEYSIAKTGKVEMKLYDVNGREAATLVNFQQNPGSYRVKFDGSKLSTGTYFVRLQAGTFSQTNKILLLK